CVAAVERPCEVRRAGYVREPPRTARGHERVDSADHPIWADAAREVGTKHIAIGGSEEYFSVKRPVLMEEHLGVPREIAKVRRPACPIRNQKEVVPNLHGWCSQRFLCQAFERARHTRSCRDGESRKDCDNDGESTEQ